MRPLQLVALTLVCLACLALTTDAVSPSLLATRARLQVQGGCSPTTPKTADCQHCCADTGKKAGTCSKTACASPKVDILAAAPSTSKGTAPLQATPKGTSTGSGSGASCTLSGKRKCVKEVTADTKPNPKPQAAPASKPPPQPACPADVEKLCGHASTGVKMLVGRPMETPDQFKSLLVKLRLFQSCVAEPGLDNFRGMITIARNEADEVMYADYGIQGEFSLLKPFGDMFRKNTFKVQDKTPYALGLEEVETCANEAHLPSEFTAKGAIVLAPTTEQFSQLEKCIEHLKHLKNWVDGQTLQF